MISTSQPLRGREFKFAELSRGCNTMHGKKKMGTNNRENGKCKVKFTTLFYPEKKLLVQVRACKHICILLLLAHTFRIIFLEGQIEAKTTITFCWTHFRYLQGRKNCLIKGGEYIRNRKRSNKATASLKLQKRSCYQF